MSKSATFESKLTALTTLIDQMDKETTSLSQALTHFESGVRLVQECQLALDEAEQTVNQLIADAVVPLDAHNDEA